MFIFILILINSHFFEFNEFKFAFDVRLRDILLHDESNARVK